MKTLARFTLLPGALAALLLAANPARAGHVYGGIIDTNGTPGLQAGDALSFVSNTTGVAVTSLSLNATLITTVGNAQQGLFRSSGPTFTALSKTGFAWEGSAYIAANPYAATAGSFLQVEIAGITGPSGAKFSFWDSGALTPTATYTLGTGLTLGTGRFDLTSDGTSYPAEAVFFGDGVTPNPTTPNGRTPSNDPYGHIHGRSFTMDQVGTYTVSYVLKDINGIHPDSAAFTVTYNAVPEPGTVALLALVGLIGFIFLRRRRAAQS